MLGKLMKYEFQALLRSLGPIYLVWIFMELLLTTTIHLRLNIFVPNWAQLAYIVAFVLLSITVFLMSFIVILDQRFYRFFYGDEGYLNLSLPIKISTHIWNKTITTTIWLIGIGFIGSLVGTFGIVTSVIGMDGFSQIASIVDALHRHGFSNFKIFLMIIEILSLSLIYIARLILKFLFTVNIGAQVNHFKWLVTAIAFIILSTIEWVITISFIDSMPSMEYTGKSIIFDYIAVGIFILYYAVQFALYFIGTHYLMTKRFNLE